jgi:hypothetical protein
LIGDLEKESGIVRYTRAHAEELRSRIEDLDGRRHIIRTELFEYARTLGVIAAYTDRPGYDEVRISGQVFDAGEKAKEIMAGLA